MVYVDSDNRAARFFAGGAAQMVIARAKTYDAGQHVEFHHQDYQKPIALDQASVDLLISQWAGFVSEACKRYLRPDGILVANNSHADAGLAGTDGDYELVGVIRKRGERYRLSTDDLEAYLVPKSADVPSKPSELREYLKNRRRGVAYRKRASHYVFRKR
jgi:SAM-dependent methyltransferase